MYNNDYTKQRVKLISLIFLCIVGAVIAIGLVVDYAKKNSAHINISNENNIDGIISDSDYNLMKTQLHKLLTAKYNIPEKQNISIVIRESSYKEEEIGKGKNLYFTIDVDDVKASYNVWLLHNSDSEIDISFGCAKQDETKYPDNFCIGSQNHSTIDTVFESELPYKGYMDNRMMYFVEHKPYTAELYAEIYNVCGDTATYDKSVKEIKDWIAAHGFKDGVIPLKFGENTCYNKNELNP